ncbi:MAG: hypothetical protein GY775_11385 [Candidatus Scalindua sp.]|nr:hypothetical protein [Candidatus Scalindua sp.]
MSKNHNIDLVRYEYIAYISLLDIDNVKEILITRDDFDDIMSNSDHIKWSPVKNMNIDIVDSVEDTVNDGEVSSGKTKNRICGLFDAEPLDWKYARILVDNKASTKYNFAVAKIPQSPIIPIIFEISE